MEKLSIKEGKDDLEEAEEDDKDTAVNIANFEGLGTGLRPVEKVTQAPKGSEDLEHFLHRLETTLLEKVKEHTPLPKLRKDKEFDDLFNELRKESKVVVPTDKTNNFTTAATKDYVKWVNDQLSETAQEVLRSYMMGLHEDAESFLKQIDFLLSEKEKQFIEETLFLKAIPQPQLLVKDHKDPDIDGNFPTKLVIPATNFTVAFSKLGYMGIKKVLDDHG
eukprot:13443432-Ditylum_brightwellii.AAC.1